MQANTEFFTIKDIFRQVLKKGNYLSLWKGNGANVVKIMPETAAKFYAFDKAKQLTSQHIKNEILNNFISGAFAGVFAQTMIYPLEIVKT